METICLRLKTRDIVLLQASESCTVVKPAAFVLGSWNAFYLRTTLSPPSPLEGGGRVVRVR